jgi:hypothetical protein
MKNIIPKNILSEILSIIGILVSMISFLITTSANLKITNEILYPIIASIIALTIGYFSKYIAETIKKFSFTKRVFISYPIEMKEVVKQYASSINKLGYKVWFDENEIKPGEPIWVNIINAINDSDIILAFISEKGSTSTLREINEAKLRGIPIIPIKKEFVSLPESIKDLKYIELNDNSEEALAEVLKTI